jgi:hypothetical protein
MDGLAIACELDGAGGIAREDSFSPTTEGFTPNGFKPVEAAA